MRLSVQRLTRWLTPFTVHDTKARSSPLVQGGLEIQIKVKVVWPQVEKRSIYRAKFEEVKYPMTRKYVDDSKEILKELGGLDEDDGDDEDDEEPGELEEDENGTTEENDLQIID